jgi:hypothetical protein
MTDDTQPQDEFQAMPTQLGSRAIGMEEAYSAEQPEVDFPTRNGLPWAAITFGIALTAMALVTIALIVTLWPRPATMTVRQAPSVSVLPAPAPVTSTIIVTPPPATVETQEETTQMRESRFIAKAAEDMTKYPGWHVSDPAKLIANGYNTCTNLQTMTVAQVQSLAVRDNPTMPAALARELVTDSQILCP